MMPYFEIGLYATILYFVYFIVIFPLIGAFEKLVYELYSRRSIEEEDKSSISGSRFFSPSFSFNVYKNRKARVIKTLLGKKSYIFYYV
jgi:hypothetical protein